MFGGGNLNFTVKALKLRGGWWKFGYKFRGMEKCVKISYRAFSTNYLLDKESNVEINYNTKVLIIRKIPKSCYRKFISMTFNTLTLELRKILNPTFFANIHY